MKVLFKEWEYSWNDNSRLKDLLIGIWNFSVDGKDYRWKVISEEYLDEDGGGKGWDCKVEDLMNENKVICDGLWNGWGRSDMDVNREGDRIDEEFLNGISVREFLMKVNDYMLENVKISDWDNVDIFSGISMCDWDDDMDYDDCYEGKEKVRNLEFEL